jgi:hypothetical protein
MALLDEEKLQGRIFNILEILRQEQSCCGIASAQWMCDDGDPVWVLVNEAGKITVYDAPGGNVITPVGTLGPVDSSGHCPAPIFTPTITDSAFTVSCIAPGPDEQQIEVTFTSNIPLGAYIVQYYDGANWVNATAAFAFIGPGTYGPTNQKIIISPEIVSVLPGDFSTRVIEINSGTLGDTVLDVSYTSCII